ncbi:MAG: hypothetical protein VX252_12665 [Myxococcota bacterium]|nr:hypothetical protein [Myxococcota bacterium]
MRTFTRKSGWALLIFLWLWPSLGWAEENLDLEGTWYVLIHYQDPETANPDVTRWKDLVWVFTRKGSRLQWTEFPLVVLEDESGRFENRQRILGAWEPNPQQRTNIENGPRVNERGMRSKTLRGSDAQGWSSARPSARRATNIMSYEETVEIEGLGEMPLFLRSDQVGSTLLSESGGATRYQVTEIKPGQRRMRGHYEKDGRLKGTFEIRRTKPIRGLKKKDKTPNQRAAEQMRKDFEE